jgi:hypothetical protein
MMAKRGAPAIRYRCPHAWDAPPPGLILMGDGPRVRRAYRVLSARRVRNALPMMGFVTWRIAVEPMSAARGREEVEAGCPRWGLQWDRR